MKNILKYTATALLAASMLTARTDAFEDLNTDPKGVTDEELKQDNNYIGMHFVPMMQSIYFNNGGGTNGVSTAKREGYQGDSNNGLISPGGDPASRHGQ